MVALTLAVLEESFINDSRLNQIKLDQLSEIQLQIDNAEELLFNGKLNSEQFERGVSKRQKRIDFINEQMSFLKSKNDSIIRDLKGSAELLSNPGHFYHLADSKTKALLVGSISPEKVIFDGSDYRTTNITSAFTTIGRGMTVFQENKSIKIGTPAEGALMSWSTRART